jgi:hypothetical protein
MELDAQETTLNVEEWTKASSIKHEFERMPYCSRPKEM